jgi:EAL domain-containing protein (putative c-di-GMP-specific phosphodiesterase class I)
LLKLDMDLIRGIDKSEPRRVVVAGVMDIAKALGISVIAEGIETSGEYTVLRDLGVRYMQGYFLAKPGFQKLPLPIMGGFTEKV